MLKAHPYLNFDGTCEEAFNFYKSIFGGEFKELMRFKDMPKPEQPISVSDSERIMHMSLQIGNSIVLMGSDILENMGQKLIKGNSISVLLEPDNKEEARRIFEKLSTGGIIEMPLQKMFWGDWFASFTDRFGIIWMVNCEDK